MARYGISEQAARNFLSIILGFVLGGVNNLIVPPWAFEGNLEDWGLIRVAAAWAALIGPIMAFGAPSAMNRFSGRFGRSEELPELYGSLLHPTIATFTLLVALPALCFPETLADLLDLEGTNRRAVGPIAILTIIQSLQLYTAGFLSTRLKTALATFIRETVFKTGYLLLALSLGMGWMAPSQFLPAFVSLYGVILVLLLAQALANGFRIRLRGLADTMARKEILVYGGTLIFGNSAWLILNQIDIIMVGQLVSLAIVPVFTIALFIATIVQVPQRSFQRLLTPLIAKALDRKDMDEVWRLAGLSHRAMLLGGGWILASIWVTTPEINAMLPEEFKGLEWVILAIGIHKVLQSSAVGTQVLIAQSDQYKKLIGLNWTMVFIAVPLNLLFIPEHGLNLGLLGAALATFAAIMISVLLRQWVVWHVWKRWIPEGRSILILLILISPCLLIRDWNPDIPPLLALTTKGAILTLWVGTTAFFLRLLPEAVKPLAKRWPELERWS